MPAQDQVIPKAKVKVKPTAKAKPAKVRVTIPDAGEATRSRTVATSSPDQADRERTPVQRQHDAKVVAKVVKVQRVKALQRKHAGSWGRALGKVASGAVKADLTNASSTGAGPTLHLITPKHGGGGGLQFAAMQPVSRNISLENGSTAAHFLKNTTSDAIENLVTLPSSVAHLGAEVGGTGKALVTGHPGKAAHGAAHIGGELAKPYVDLVKTKGKSAFEHPVSTALMVAPIGRLPGRVAGRVLRKTGKQTLARPPASLPGTALQEARTGSRDAAVRAVQAGKDAKRPAPTVTAKDVQRRVDEHYDAGKHHSHRAVGEAVKAVKVAVKGQPKHVRDAAVEAAREQAHVDARAAADVRFAKEFGANVRLSAGAAVREAAHKIRRQAVAKLDTAKAANVAARSAHETAWTNLRAARNAARTSPLLRTLEFGRRDAQRDLTAAQTAAAAARAAHAKAIGRAEVLSRTVAGRSVPKNGIWAAGGHGVTTAKAAVDATAKVVQDTRARIRDFDQKIADEHARPLPPAHPARKAFTDSIQARRQAQADLATARAEAHAASRAHIDAKRDMTNASLVNPAGEGRLFAHKADAATVVKKLNEHAATTAAKEPVTFVLRQVGDDRWAAIPQAAAARLTKHHVVGTSPATMAKVMRVSRGAFTSSVLPLSAKWLAGQGVEAGVRAAVAGAGPMDWLRMGHVVKKLNKEKPGLGDELATRITGGHFDLTGPARDFANGKSLAEEFEDTPLAKVAGAATKAGAAPGLKHVRQGWGAYTRAVLGTVNHVIESNARRAMAGQAIKDLGFQDLHINGLSDAALEDAAKGLKGTHNQVALARAVDRMYGQYQKFSPEKRSLLMHWTPFLPWYMNTANFLFKVLPVDHPVKAALLADVNVAEEQWRKDHGLSTLAPHVPGFMLGGAPTKDGKYLNIAHYTPWGIGSDPVGAASDLMLPQFLGPLKNAGGVDWKWQTLTHGGAHGQPFSPAEKALRAATTLAEEQIPGVTQAGKISGVTPRFVDKDSPENVKSAGDVLKGYLPWTAATGNVTSSGGSSSAASPTRVKIPGSSSGARVKIPGMSSGARVKIPGGG